MYNKDNYTTKSSGVVQQIINAGERTVSQDIGQWLSN